MTNTETSWFQRHRRLIGIGIIVVLGVAGFIFIAGLAPWSRLNNEEQELDLYSGRARFTRYFMCCQIKQEIRETPLSEVLGISTPTNEEKWVYVNIFQPGISISPHCIYHGAFFQIDKLGKWWSVGNLDQSAQMKTSRQLLQVWREGGSYFAADHYFNILEEWIIDRNSDQPITAADIPDDLATRSLAEYTKQRKKH